MSRLALLRIATLPFDALASFEAESCRASLERVLDNEKALASRDEAISALLYVAAGPGDTDAGRSSARFALLRARRDLHNRRRVRAGDLEAARARLEPADFASLAEHVERVARREALRAAYEASFETTLERARGELQRIAADPLVEHGIYLASRSLLPKLRALRERDPRRLPHDERHTLAKLAAYVVRFATKTSPNGVFCAVAPARIEGDRTRCSGRPGIAHVEVLLSLAEVRKISACLAVDPTIERAIRPRPNPTLRRSGESFSYWKPASPRNPDDTEVHARVKEQAVLRAFLEEGEAPHDVASLLGAVSARTGRPAEELRPFYAALVERGILIGEIEIPYSSRRRLRDLAAVTRARGADAPWIATLEAIEDEVDALSALDPCARTQAMERITRTVESLPRRRPFMPDELFRLDAASSLEISLPHRILDELRGPLRAIAKLLGAMYPEERNHRILVARFLKQHAPDTDVEFLDVYGSLPEPEDASDARPLEFPAPAESAAPGSMEAAAHAAARRVWDWFVARARDSTPGESVEVGEDTLRALVGEAPEPRWATGVLFQIAATSLAEIDAGRYQLVLNALFNGIGLALARFAHLLARGRAAADDPVGLELRRAWSSMERPGAVLAELTFNHEARTANAGLRPILFRHEIELPGDRSSPGVDAIPLADLVIRYDSAAQRIVLRSRSRGIEVIPVLSSGVSPSGIVSELIHIGRQGWQTLGYLPGFHAPQIVRWPRFTCGKLVLFRARWVLRGELLPPASDGARPLSEAAYFLELARWRSRLNLPRHVYVHTQAEPKPFYVDLEAPLLVDLLRRALATALAAGNETVLFVTEMLPAPDQLFVREAQHAYATEFLVQMENPEPQDLSS